MADWQELRDWTPEDGQWAVLWPGYYGPFTAVWYKGRWTMCEDYDLRYAQFGMGLDLMALDIGVTRPPPPAS